MVYDENFMDLMVYLRARPDPYSVTYVVLVGTNLGFRYYYEFMLS